ncbi:MAG: polyphosphate kinase 2 family protein [Candidatus Baltobacteraceae bacterium]
MPKTIDHADLLAKPGHDVHLAEFDPAFTSDFKDKHDAKENLHDDIKHLSALQDTFYADQRYALLIIFQGMDAAGKDGAIRHVMSGVSPQGVDVYPFKQPSTQELSHDYLWRCAKVLPERGRIAIFNRSYYEELTVVRVHESLLEREQLPPEPSGAQLWKDRYHDIVSLERHLVRNGTLILKFFLHLSKDEQRKRLLDRIDMPEKNWKISPADVNERAFWESYRHAYEELLTHTSTESAPWYIIPADRKWFTRAAIANVIVARLKALGLAYPSVTDEQRSQLEGERAKLADGTKG